MMKSRLLALSLALAAAVCLGLAQPASAASASAFDVRALTCPVEYTGTDYAGQCPPTAKIAATVVENASNASSSGATGSDGVVHIANLAAGSYTITLDVPGDFNKFVTFCGAPGEKEPRQLTNPNTNQIGVELRAGETVTCSFYIIPENAKGNALPSTGVGPLASPSSNAWLPLALLAGTFGLAGLALRRAER